MDNGVVHCSHPKVCFRATRRQRSVHASYGVRARRRLCLEPSIELALFVLGGSRSRDSLRWPPFDEVDQFRSGPFANDEEVVLCVGSAAGRDQSPLETDASIIVGASTDDRRSGNPYRDRALGPPTVLARDRNDSIPRCHLMLHHLHEPPTLTINDLGQERDRSLSVVMSWAISTSPPVSLPREVGRPSAPHDSTLR